MAQFVGLRDQAPTSSDQPSTRQLRFPVPDWTTGWLPSWNPPSQTKATAVITAPRVTSRSARRPSRRSRSMTMATPTTIASQTVRRLSTSTNSSSRTLIHADPTFLLAAQPGGDRQHEGARQEEGEGPVDHADGGVRAELLGRHPEVDSGEDGEPAQAHEDHHRDGHGQPDPPDPVVEPDRDGERREVEGNPGEEQVLAEFVDALLHAERRHASDERHEEQDAEEQQPALVPVEAPRPQEPQHRGSHDQRNNHVGDVDLDLPRQHQGRHPVHEERLHHDRAEHQRRRDVRAA